MRRRTLLLLSLGTALLFLVYGSLRVSDVREEVIREYLRHKEFLSLISKVEVKNRADEASVRRTLEDLGIRPERVASTDQGVEVVVGEVSWRDLPRLVKVIEDRFDLVTLEAVDNTGRGRFRVRVVVR